jgi:biotin carboxyl carrier protein
MAGASEEGNRDMFSQTYVNENNEQVKIQVTVIEEGRQRYRVTVGEEVFEFPAEVFHHAAFAKRGGDILLQVQGREYCIADPVQRRKPGANAGGTQAPMAGKIIQILVQPGDAVQAGDVLLILEAMKMEQQILAPQDGVVERILCRENEQVSAGAELVVMRAGQDS